MKNAKQENEMANLIYDTLMNNTRHKQFPIDKTICQEITNNTISFEYKNKHYEISTKVITPIPFEVFYVYAESKGFDNHYIDDYFEWYENLLPLEENLEHLKNQIEARYA